MTTIQKQLLILEVVVCFTPIVLLLLLGIVMSGFQLLLVARSDVSINAEWGGISVISSTTAGLLGMFALFNVLRKIFNPNASAMNRWLALLFTIMAIGAISPVLADGQTLLWKLVAILPLLSTAHLVYLGRGYLFSEESR